jgi:chromosome segregation protein
VKLKRLEIIGFKSFAEKTVIKFEQDITAIVGPNGCGKSNVVDAIRWVMGEQSAKHLRGKLMEDVIFAGSSSRAPQSMASVELTFSTEGYETPAEYLDHTEIAICRRLYRTGESEYFINKTQVRLKDITDLFLGTGIGTKAYSVIEQGRISQIVTAKPEERRFYIEEVAGITRFKSRKESALRKIDATNQNLLRLNDLIDELDRQMKSLDRQAKKAEKYKGFKDEYQKWDLALSSNQFSKYQEDQKGLESEIKNFDEQEIDLKTKLTEAENKLEIRKNQLSEEESKLTTLQNQVFEVTNYVRVLENTIGYKKEELTKLTSNEENILDQIRLSEERITHIKKELNQKNERKVELDLSLEELKEDIDEKAPLLKEDEEKLSSLSQELSEKNLALKDHQSRLAQIDTILDNHQKRKIELTDLKSENETEILETNKKIEELTQDFTKTNESLEGLKQLKLDLSRQSSKLDELLFNAKKDLAKQKNDLDEIKTELTNKKSRLDSLIELQKNFEGYGEGARQVLLKKDEIAVDGIFGTVADFVETDSKYEGAVSALLGEKLQNIIVKSHHEGVSAIDYLSTHSQGRASFVPVDLNYTETNDEVYQDQEGVVGPLLKYVRFKNDQNQFLPGLFQNVILVNDLDIALNLWQKNEHRKTFVTLNGEILESNGVLTGGSIEDTSKALLEKKREVKEISKLIETLSDKLYKKENKINELTKQVENLDSELEEIKKNSFEEEIRIAHQEKDTLHFKKEIESLNKLKENLTRKLDQANEQLSKIDPEVINLNEEKEEIENISKELEESLNSHQGELSTLTEKVQNLRSSLSELQIEQTKKLSARDTLDQEINRLTEEVVLCRISIKTLHFEWLNSLATQSFLELYLTHLHKVLDKRMEKKSKKDEELASLKESYDQEVASLRELEISIRELRKGHLDASSKLNQMTSSLTTIRTEMKYLIEQALERHQVDLPNQYLDYVDEELDVAEAQKRVKELKFELNRIGAVNTDALAEFEETKERFEFLSTQKNDLEESLQSLTDVIDKINQTTKERFEATFHAVNENFKILFPKMFRGGKAELLLTDENNMLETGVEIIAQPPGKKLQSINLLSGGEKALTAVSLVFSIFNVKPSPFCILDEVDAPLDDVNVSRYNETLRSMTNNTQFIVITHNKKTMELADVLYGVTMQEPGSSRLVSVDLHE